MKSNYFFAGLALMMWSSIGCAMTCPDPETSSLQWGEPPTPWVVNPYSQHPPQGEEGTRFVRANILVAQYGLGVVCTYRSSLGDYSIWLQALTKIPALGDYSWIRTLGGYVCTQGVDECHFFVAEF